MSEVFPVTLLPVKGWREPRDWQNLQERGRGSLTQVVETLTAPVWEASGSFELSAANEALLQAFFDARRGAAESFYFYSALARKKRLALACGTGDGTAKTFPAPIAYPFTDEITPVAHVAGSAKVYGTAFALGVANSLTKSEDFSDTSAWPVGTDATVTRTSGQTNPLGGATAWRIATSGGSATTKLTHASHGTPTTAQVQRISIWVKNTGAKALTITDGLGGTTTLAGGGSAWQEVVLTTTGTGGASTLSFLAPASGDSLTFYVWHPWAVVTHAVLGAPAASWLYVPTDASAIAAAASGCWQVVIYPAVSAPTAGQAVTLGAQGRERILCRFAPAMKYDPEPYKYNKFRVGVQLQEAAS